MKAFLASLQRLLPALMILAAAAPGHAQMLMATPSVSILVQPVAADCGAIGRLVAANEGGTVRSAVAEICGGRMVCVIVYTLPAQGGQPPRVVRTRRSADMKVAAETRNQNYPADFSCD
ncbi:hypothetical protein [Aquibium sp. ELW1220]|uniref:hypothetical protein n=1 Tax=Aquibium sp. ELW1220 TaxID=2976766 RepID=UPI0025B16208|nr:hypothetical protein [Aquibium sp. ELW1220]MDN2584204.1 hypothetical protein [Aquibium sp. ELW1220]